MKWGYGLVFNSFQKECHKMFKFNRHYQAGQFEGTITLK